MKNKLRAYILSLCAKDPKGFDEKIFELTVRLLSQNKRNTDVIFLHGRSASDAEPLIFHHTAELANYIDTTVYINGGDGSGKYNRTPQSSWPGGTFFKEQLSNKYVKNIKFIEPALDTEKEAESALKMLLNDGLKSICLVAWQHQTPRCFLCMVKAMKKIIGNTTEDRKSWPKVYVSSPSNTSWTKIVTGSQGLNPMQRSEHSRLELLGIKNLLKENKNLLQDAVNYLDKTYQ